MAKKSTKWHYFWVAVVKWNTRFLSCSKSKSSARTAINCLPPFLLPNVLRVTRDKDQACISHCLLLPSLHCKSQQSHLGLLMQKLIFISHGSFLIFVSNCHRPDYLLWPSVHLFSHLTSSHSSGTWLLQI